MIISLLLAQSRLERLAATTAYADTIQTVQMVPSFVMDKDASIAYWARLYGASAYEMTQTVSCESNFDPTALNSSSGARGLVQILPSAHKDVTKAQMNDPDWSIQFMAKNWNIHKRWWECARLLGFVG